MFISYRRPNPGRVALSGLSAGFSPYVGQALARGQTRLAAELMQKLRRHYRQSDVINILGPGLPQGAPPPAPPTASALLRPFRPIPSGRVKRRYVQSDVIPPVGPGLTSGSPPLLSGRSTRAARERHNQPRHTRPVAGFIPRVPPTSAMPLAAPPFTFAPRGRRWLPAMIRRGWRLNPGSPPYFLPVPLEGDSSAAQPVWIAPGAPFAAGFAILGISWVSASAVAVSFDTSYGTSYLYQLYAGRTLIGATNQPDERALLGQLIPSRYPQWLTLLAVEPAQRDTDYGALLPPNPYNRVHLRWESAGMPADCKWIEITAGTAAGGAVNLSNVIALVPFDTNRFYDFITLPLPGSGNWNFQIAHRDACPPSGNRGAAVAVSAAIDAVPPDLVPDYLGNRLNLATSGGVATASFTYPSD